MSHAPSKPHCVCFSGLTEGQLQLLKYVAHLEAAADLPLRVARACFESPGADHRPELAKRLESHEKRILELLEEIRPALWPAGSPR